MGAWKLRALVYGMLAVVAALVLVARAEHESSARVAPADELVGRGAHGSPVHVQLRDGKLVSFRIDGVRLTCWNGARRTWNWGLAAAGPRTTYTPWRDGFTVHTREPRFDVWLHGQVGAGARRVEGYFEMSEVYKGGTCESGRVAFTASR